MTGNARPVEAPFLLGRPMRCSSEATTFYVVTKSGNCAMVYRFGGAWKPWRGSYTCGPLEARETLYVRAWTKQWAADKLGRRIACLRRREDADAAAADELHPLDPERPR